MHDMHLQSCTCNELLKVRGPLADGKARQNVSHLKQNGKRGACASRASSSMAASSKGTQSDFSCAACKIA